MLCWVGLIGVQLKVDPALLIFSYLTQSFFVIYLDKISVSLRVNDFHSISPASEHSRSSLWNRVSVVCFSPLLKLISSIMCFQWNFSCYLQTLFSDAAYRAVVSIFPYLDLIFSLHIRIGFKRVADRFLTSLKSYRSCWATCLYD